MKKHCIWAVVALGFAAAISMGWTDSQELTTKTIVKQYNAMLAQEGEAEVFADIRVGTYECNSSYERLILAQLDAAGLIDYDVTRYAWWEKEDVKRQKPYYVKELRGSWYYSWTETVTKYKWVEETVYTFEDHYVVNVKLTLAGKKLVADIPEVEEELDKDLISKEVDPETYKWNKKDLSEEWPYIPNPFLKPEPEETTPEEEPAPEPEETTPVYIDELEEEVEVTDTEDKVERIEAQQYEAYNALSLDSEIVTLKAGTVKAIKARNILLVEADGIQTAEAEVITETCNATDAGRILVGFENGERDLDEVTLIYYLDKGWVLE